MHPELSDYRRAWSLVDFLFIVDDEPGIVEPRWAMRTVAATLPEISGPGQSWVHYAFFHVSKKLGHEELVGGTATWRIWLEGLERQYPGTPGVLRARESFESWRSWRDTR